MKISVCKFCGTEIRTKRETKQFCSDECRWRHWARLHPRTKRAESPLDDIIPCYYCGLPADTVDHVPPRTLRKRLREVGLKDRYPEHEVQACFECNSLLGARPLFTVETRKRFIKSAIRTKYNKYFRMPSWSDKEIAELGPTLRTSVLSAILASEVTKERIKW